MAEAAEHTIMLVDDEGAILRALQRLFRREGYRILTAEGGRQALGLLSDADDPVSLIISDQRMPEMTGIELMRKIKEINPATRRILVTGYSDINIVVDALNEGLLWKYVAKPWDHDELRQLVLKGARQYLREEGLDEEEYGFRGGFMGL